MSDLITVVIKTILFIVKLVDASLFKHLALDTIWWKSTKNNAMDKTNI